MKKLFDPLEEYFRRTTPNPNGCPECGGDGTVLVDLDSDRSPTRGPCPLCQMYCKRCQSYHRKDFHDAHPKR